MARGALDPETLDKTGKQLPEIENLRSRIRKLNVNPLFLTIKFPRESEIPMAAVCFNDVGVILGEVGYAMHKILAHKAGYLEKENPSAAVCFSQYYAIDGIFRLYSAAEHLAKAIIFIIEDKTLENKGRSRLLNVCKTLKESKPDDMITEAVEKLTHDHNWKRLSKIRNDWVHNELPMLAGPGIVYDWRERIKKKAQGLQVGFGGGDKPQYTDDELFNILNSSMKLFLETVWAVLESFHDILKQNNISIDNEGNTIIKVFK